MGQILNIFWFEGYLPVLPIINFCHDYVVRTTENWCRHLDCRVIQCMLPKLLDLVGNELSPIKKGKTTSQHQVHYNSDRAIMVSSLHQASQPKRQKPQSYRQCRQFVIYTICICECVQHFRRRTWQTQESKIHQTTYVSFAEILVFNPEDVKH